MTPRSLVIVVALLVGACASDGVDATDAASAPVSDAETSTSTIEKVADVESDGVEDAGAESDEPGDVDAVTTDTTESETSSTTTEPEPAESGPSDVEFAPLTVNCSTIPRAPIGLQTGSIVSGGVEYKVQWTVPSSYDGSPIPVVLDFHGIGSNGAQQAVFSGWAALAEAEGFLAVEPTGVATAPDDRASWELPQFDTAQRDDIAMVRDLLDHIASNVCIDPSRVYSTGMSNGGFFTSVVVCELSEFIAAAVSVAGVTHDDSCEPSRPVPYLAFHGTADTTVPFRGGGETTLEGSDGGAFFEQVMPEEFAEFAESFGCTESTDSQVSEAVTLTAYAGCDQDTEMGFYTIDGGGHTWPGSVISSAIPSLGVTTLEIDATAIAWDFFQRHAR